jgi:Ca-activated chloride channel family protein
LCAFNPFQKQNPDTKAGNEAYSEGKFDQALGSYDEALKTTKDSPQSHYNRGDALYKQGRFEEALGAYMKASGGGDDAFKSKALYNAGNSLAKTNKTGEAIDAYIRSLMLDPKNSEAKYNLELLLQQQQQKQQQPEPKENQQKDALDRMKEQEKSMQQDKQMLKDFKKKDVEKDW